MTDKKIMRVRKIIAIASLTALLWIYFDWISNKVQNSSHRWHPNLFLTILFIIAFIVLANGVSYLSEIPKAGKSSLKILTGIIAGMVFLFVLFPQNHHLDSLTGQMLLIGLTSSSILISFLSTREWSSKKRALKWLLPLIFAVCSGVYVFCVFITIIRNENPQWIGYFVIIYSAVLSLISIAVNMISLSLQKNS